MLTTSAALRAFANRAFFAFFFIAIICASDNWRFGVVAVCLAIGSRWLVCFAFGVVFVPGFGPMVWFMCAATSAENFFLAAQRRFTAAIMLALPLAESWRFGQRSACWC